METCEHQWIKIHQQSLLGCHFPIGWQCGKCNRYVANADVTPAGLPGTVTTKHKLVGVHGGGIKTDSGKQCKSQTYDEKTGELSYES